MLFKKGDTIKKSNGESVELNDNEIKFSNRLICELEKENIYKELNLDFKSGNIINYCVDKCQIGRVKLRGTKFTIQLISENNVTWIDNITFQQAITYIPIWVNYAKQLGFINEYQYTEGVNKMDNNFDEIAKLKELLDSGAITQEEFEQQKNKLLNTPAVPVQPPIYQTPVQNFQPQVPVKKKKTNGCLIALLIVLFAVIGFIIFVVVLANITGGNNSNNKNITTVVETTIESIDYLKNPEKAIQEILSTEEDGVIYYSVLIKQETNWDNLSFFTQGAIGEYAYNECNKKANKLFSVDGFIKEENGQFAFVCPDFGEVKIFIEGRYKDTYRFP